MYPTRVLLLALSLYVLSLVDGFFSTGPLRSRSTLTMGINPTPSGFASTREGKKAIVERTKKLIDDASLIAVIPSSGISVEQVDFLRKELPAGTVASVVKNTLFKVAVKDTPFDAMKDQEDMTYPNMYFFVPEGESKPTFQAFAKFKKEFPEKHKKLEAKFACMEGGIYRDAQFDAVTNLPTKDELYTKIAIAIKAVPTKVAQGVKAVPSKLGRAIGAIKDQKEKEGA